jgi:hypothetical protein
MLAHEGRQNAVEPRAQPALLQLGLLTQGAERAFLSGQRGRGDCERCEDQEVCEAHGRYGGVVYGKSSATEGRGHSKRELKDVQCFPCFSVCFRGMVKRKGICHGRPQKATENNSCILQLR